MYLIWEFNYEHSTNSLLEIKPNLYFWKVYLKIFKCRSEASIHKY